MPQLRLRFCVDEKPREVEIEVIYSNRKTLGLEVGQNGQVKLRAPQRVSEQALLGFVQEKKEWIVRKVLFMEELRDIKAQREVPDYIRYPALEQKYRSQARERLQQRTAYFAQLMGVSYGKITIKETKTRWGSCSTKGNLNFHWKLVLMPPEILDYMVVHELAHRKEMNHSPAFWAEVERILPDYRKRRRWLKCFGQEV